MDFATAVDRVRDDFTAMPGLELTVPQAVRLWHLGADDCRSVLDALVDAGFLQWTPRWTIARRETRDGRDRPSGGSMDAAHIPVRVTAGRNKSVGM
jgi:hypothetical protein